MRYELGPNLDVIDAGVLFDMTAAEGEDAIDGLKVDVEANVYACGPGGVWVISPGGEHLGTVRPPEAPHNLAWGDADGQTLYVTALTSVYRIRLQIPSIQPH
jgi:gluconolactonase